MFEEKLKSNLRLTSGTLSSLEQSIITKLDCSNFNVERRCRKLKVGKHWAGEMRCGDWGGRGGKGFRGLDGV